MAVACRISCRGEAFPVSCCPHYDGHMPHVWLVLCCRGIFVTGSSLVGAAIRVPRITSKNLIRYATRVLWCGTWQALRACSGHVRARQQGTARAPVRCCSPTHPLLSPRSIIFCEAVAIYGVIVAIILQTKLEAVTREQGLYSKGNMAAGYAIFGAGITCGFSNLVCGWVRRDDSRQAGRQAAPLRCRLVVFCPAADTLALCLSHVCMPPLPFRAGFASASSAAAAPCLMLKTQHCLSRSSWWRSLAARWACLA